MIEAYRIAVALVLDQTKLTGPLGEALKSFERVNRAVQDTQAGINEMTSSLRGASRVAAGLADAMERVARATQAGAGRPGIPAGIAPGVAGSGGPRMPLLLPPPSGGGAMTLYGGAGAAGGGGGDFGLPPLVPLGNGPGGINWGAGIGLMYRGMAAVQVVDMVVSGIGHLIDKAKGLNDAVAVLQMRGATPQQTDQLRALAFDIAGKIPGRGLDQIMTDAANLRAVLGVKEGSADPLADVKTMLPTMERIAAALHATTGVDNENAMHMLLRAVELRGGLIDEKTHRISESKFGTELETIYKVLTSGGGMITPNDMLNLMQQAGPMARMMDAKQFYSMMMTAVLDMKGNRAGTALTAVGRQLFGGRMSLAFAKEMEAIGLVDKNAFHSAGAGYVTMDPKASADLTKTLQGGLFNWVNTVLRGKLEEHGYDTVEKQNKELYRLFSTETARRLIALFLQNTDQVLRDQKLIQSTPGSKEALEIATRKDIGYNLDAMETSFGNMLKTIEAVNADKIISVLHGATELFDFLTKGEHAIGNLDKDWDKATHGHGAFYNYGPFDRRFWVPDPHGEDHDNVHKEAYYLPHNQSRPIQLTSYTTLDGRVIAKTVSKYQSDALSLPNPGVNRFDPRQTVSHPSDTLGT